MNPPQVYLCSPSRTLLPPHTLPLSHPSAPAPRIQYWKCIEPGLATHALWSSNPTSGHTHWGNQKGKRHVYPNVHCSTVYNSQDMEATFLFLLPLFFCKFTWTRTLSMEVLSCLSGWFIYLANIYVFSVQQVLF